jgi:hypothetical protein
MKLEWIEDWDEDGNSIYEANSPFYDDGTHFKFRIKQRLANNRIEFYDASDAECSLGGESWPTLAKAKAAMQKASNGILKEYENV